ncbi:hypothetical protein GOQ27_07120 [Clostridium sp. D2Q-11]|uniref:Uncharacterized protein n=1 Tax=Anaeromonas frigoriresistens TaxID=2683708 RepID=A0A942UTD7_9FIRM|nr:hypothetical protein [Anaeromonas frigoriresistens]MBS4538228.1 hypothetical protein [Anaeromonas frigoriresistens]
MVDHELKYSLQNHKIISIMYMKGLEITQRRIQVLKIDKGIIKALDIDKQAIRTFKKENILAAMNMTIINESRSGKHESY